MRIVISPGEDKRESTRNLIVKASRGDLPVFFSAVRGKRAKACGFSIAFEAPEKN
jgi:hypothetical protein